MHETGTSRGQLEFRAEDQVDKIGFGVKQASGGLATGTDTYFSVFTLRQELSPLIHHPN